MARRSSGQKTLKRVTQRDIAERANVAVATVSSALHNTGRIGLKQRERICRIAAEMGYQPKVAAQLLRANQTGRLALLVPRSDPTESAESGFTGPIISEFVQACNQIGIGYHINFMTQLNRSEACSYRGPEAYTSGFTDGALVAGYVASRAIRRWLDANHENYPWIAVDEPAKFSVLNDTDGGIYHATEQLVQLGHRRIGYLGIDSRFRTHREGLAGFERAVRDMDIDTHDGRWVCLHPQTPKRTKAIALMLEAGGQLFEGPVRPTAVVTQGVPQARSVIYMAMERGLKVPENLSIVTFGTGVDAEKGPPCLHCVEANVKVMVKTGIEMLRSIIDGQTLEKNPVTVSPHLVERDSIAPPDSSVEAHRTAADLLGSQNSRG